MASYRVTTRTGCQDFHAAEVLDDLRTTGTGYAENTIKTMISSHMVTDGSFIRVARGVYRIASPLPRVAPSAAASRPLAAISDGGLLEIASRSRPGPYPSGSCQGCGKEGMVFNTHCKRCRNAGM